MIRYSTPWALNASKSCFRSSGRIIVCTLELVGGSGRVPYRSKPFAHRTALPVAVDFCLLFLMAGESTDCLVQVHAEYLHLYYIPFSLLDGPVLHRPILHNQPLHSLELPRIRRDQNEVSTVGLSGDQRIIFANAMALTFQLGANLPSGLCVLLAIVEHNNIAVQKCSQSTSITGGLLIFGRAVPKLMYHNR